LQRVSPVRILLTTTVLVAGFLFVATSSALAQGSKPLPALTQTSPDALTRALATGELTPAQYALERAESLFRPRRVAARYGSISRPNPHDATLILRDLAIRVRDLSGADRERALALLARPTDNPNPDDSANTYGAVPEHAPYCGTNVCIHYVTSGPHAVDLTDANTNLVPDYVESALNVFQNTVWATEVTSRGYKAPKSDVSSTNNGTSASDLTGAKFDVYLADVGDDGLYGYCTTDDPHLQGGYNFYDMSAYCVVDNDFSASQFPAHTPLENLEVTAAHEFFHAVQFAYDAFEDQWILEATATWMEDLLYDDVNDNLQYLSSGPLRKPGIPLDRSSISQTDFHVYGDWIFFRYLSETFNPGKVRLIWNRADASEDTDLGGPDGIGPDDFSVQAVSRVLSSRGGFRSRFADFGWMNRIARVPGVYDEGADNGYPQAPLTDPAQTLSKSAPRRSKSPKLDHQTNAYYEFKRGSGFSSTAKLKVILNLPARSTGSAASVLVYRKNGSISPFTLGITSAGDGFFKIPFGSSVAKVDVILTNASTRYTNCYPLSNPTPYACNGGKPRDDGMAYKLTARV
jgi:hypothetical protein